MRGKEGGVGWGGDGLRDGGVSGFDCHILKYFKLTSIQVGAAVGCVVPCTETRNTDRQTASRTDGRADGRPAGPRCTCWSVS